METTYAQIKETIDQADSEAVFVASDFSQIAPINTVRQVFGTVGEITADRAHYVRRVLSACIQ